MKNIIALSLIVCSFSTLANNQQSLNSENLQPYRSSAEDYISNLFNATCELTLKGDIKTDIPLDKAITGVVSRVTQGMEKGTKAYSIIHDTVLLGAAVGQNLKEKGKTITQDKVVIHTCGEFVSYLDRRGAISGFAADLNTPEQPVRTKSGNDGSDKRVYRTTATALAEMYDENEVAADDKIGGRKVEVTGVVQSIDKDFTDSVVVSLQSDNDYMPARFGMEDSEKSQASRLRKGQTVSITCEKMRFFIGSPSGRSCRFN
ncbi:OB-fold putative lipoprotein [Klebsiella sp. BIGb0407]|uniref:OB-fold putative lipoprotein n=1 Tax=Klebsiella sp. BIGb0407 TaxID=2940603 RepID=UPI0021686C89|nr:OB-fold putative lipoprotein [Klebsiella sp. BIGb0407]MCS3430135.1 hypothetical protein [Klebsiella sp. BIGb0407]